MGDEQSPLNIILEALKSSGQPWELGGRRNGKKPPLILAAAEGGHWGAVHSLLLQSPSGGNVGAESLMQRKNLMSRAPPTIKYFAQERVQKDEIAAAKAPS